MQRFARRLTVLIEGIHPDSIAPDASIRQGMYYRCSWLRYPSLETSTGGWLNTDLMSHPQIDRWYQPKLDHIALRLAWLNL